LAKHQNLDHRQHELHGWVLLFSPLPHSLDCGKPRLRVILLAIQQEADALTGALQSTRAGSPGPALEPEDGFVVVDG